MGYIDVVKELLPIVFSKIKENTLQEPEIFQFVNSKEELINFLNTQEKLLTEYFLNFPDDTQINTDKIKKFFENLNIPYIIVAKNLDILKASLLERISLEKELDNKEFLFDVKRYIEKLQNKIAYIYLKKDINSLSDTENTVFNKYLLYKFHTDYISKIIASIENEKIDEFPLIDARKCSFYEYLSYPESLMVCLDANICSYIENLHEIIHKLGNSFYMFYIKENYTDAYIVFKELLDNVLKLSKTLSEIYFIGYSDAEGNFFKLLEYLEDLPTTTYVFIIDIKNLKSLNKIYSERKVNIALKQIEEKLMKFADPKRKNFLLIKGITANFYMLAEDITKDTAKKTGEYIKSLIDGTYQVNGSTIDISSTIGVLEIDKYSENSKDDIIKILLHIKDEAKKNNKSIYIIDTQEEKEKLKNWINQKYQNSSFIRDKISNKDIEVVFQPIFNTKTLSIDHLETLARIKEKDKLIPAGVFIDLIYELGIVKSLDELVLEKIIEKKEKIKLVSNDIFVNLSPEALTSYDFIPIIENFAKEMKDFNITIEITEQKLIQNIEIITKLHNEVPQIKFAIDDFGTGYSSLKTVADLAEQKLLDVIKIDGSLIKDLDKRNFVRKVVKAISSLAQNLSVETVAEFVENENILQILKELNIQQAQGYFLMKPKQIEELILYKLNNQRGD